VTLSAGLQPGASVGDNHFTLGRRSALLTGGGDPTVDAHPGQKIVFNPLILI